MNEAMYKQKEDIGYNFQFNFKLYRFLGPMKWYREWMLQS